MEYRQYRPSDRLSALVRCIWTLEGEAAELGAGVQTVLPDGRPELVVHLGDTFERVHAYGGVERQPTVLFAGQLTGQLALRPTGRIAVVGVRFHPYGAAALVRDAQIDLVGLTIGVGDVAASLAKSLGNVRDTPMSLADAARAVQEHVLASADPARIDPRVRHAVGAIEGARGRISIDALAGTVGLTRRHLERRFNTAVGISPKRLARITRFQEALRIVEASEGRPNGTQAAEACGYADQAHFIREFRELAGCSPGAHIVERTELAGLFLK